MTEQRNSEIVRNKEPEPESNTGQQKTNQGKHLKISSLAQFSQFSVFHGFPKLPSATSFIRKMLGETVGLIERGCNG